MERDVAEKYAENIVKKVVNMIANKKYDEIIDIAQLGTWTSASIEELVEGYLEINDIMIIDCYDVPCNTQFSYEYRQLNFYHYNDGTGFGIDYDLTTQGEINDLTLQMEFLYDDKQGLVAKFEDLHVL